MIKIVKKVLFILIIIFLLFSIYFIYDICTAKKQYYINEKNLIIPIYTYHELVTSNDQIETDYMQTTCKNFESQISGLLKLGYTPITYPDLYEYKSGKKAIPKKSCIITFDDGYESVYTYAYPIIKKYNIPISIFIIANCVDSSNYMNWNQIKELHDSGIVSVYSHGLNHSEYDKLPASTLLEETNKSYEIITQNLNNQNILKVFAYPCSLYTEEEIDLLAQNGYIQNLMDGKINRSNSLNIYKLHRIYPLNDSVPKILLKRIYKIIKYRT